MNARVLVAHAAVPALSDTALHTPFQRHQNAVLREPQRQQLLEHEAINDGWAANRGERRIRAT